MSASHCASNLEIHRGSSVFGVDSHLVTKHMVEMESSENKVVDATRVRPCHTVLVSEVKALKTELNLLKRSLDEEKEARKFGDSLSGEAILQLQTALELDLTQHLTSENKLRQHFEAEISWETSNFKETLENTLSQNNVVSKDLRAFRVELDREFRSQFEQFDRRFQEAQHKFKNLTNAVLSTSIHEFEIMQKVSDERVKCQLEGVVKPHNLPMFEEQTDSADDGAVDVVDPTMKESVRRRIARWEVRGTRDQDTVVEQTVSVNEKETSYSWDLLKTFDQDMIIDQTDCASCASEEEMHCFVGNLVST
jgi:hypothetical protein